MNCYFKQNSYLVKILRKCYLFARHFLSSSNSCFHANLGTIRKLSPKGKGEIVSLTIRQMLTNNCYRFGRTLFLNLVTSRNKVCQKQAMTGETCGFMKSAQRGQRQLLMLKKICSLPTLFGRRSSP